MIKIRLIVCLNRREELGSELGTMCREDARIYEVVGN